MSLSLLLHTSFVALVEMPSFLSFKLCALTLSYSPIIIFRLCLTQSNYFPDMYIYIYIFGGPKLVIISTTLTIFNLQFVIGLSIPVIKCMTTVAVQSITFKINLIFHLRGQWIESGIILRIYLYEHKGYVIILYTGLLSVFVWLGNQPKISMFQIMNSIKFRSIVILKFGVYGWQSRYHHNLLIFFSFKVVQVFGKASCISHPM